MNLREWARATHWALVNQPADERRQDFSIADVECVLRTSVTTLIDTLVAGDNLRLDELGRLWVEERRPHFIVSNLSGRPRKYQLSSRRVVRFSASSRLQKRLTIGATRITPTVR